MHCQFYDGEEELEPRAIPKPMTKQDCFVMPTVPEISLIFEKPTVRNPNDASADPLPARSARSVQISDNTIEVTNPTSSISCNPNSYAAWKEQNYSKEISSTTHGSPLYKNTYNYAMSSGLQNASVQKRQGRIKINDKQDTLQNTNKNDRMYEKSVKFTPDIQDSYVVESPIRPKGRIKISDKQETLQNTNKNDRMYEKSVKFTPDIQDSYVVENPIDLSSGKKERFSSDSQKAMLSVIDRTMGMSNNAISDTLKKSEHCQVPHVEYQRFHVPNSNYNIDNNETVKTLLQLVHSQNQQIKNLQLQIDRLTRIQEENFKNKSTCLCSLTNQPLANQVFRYPINCYDPALASSLAQSQNQSIKKNVASQNTPAAEKQDLENFGENNKLEQQSKKAFMEQKVSIGVMTSFEFTVQNSPFLIDSEICETNEAHRESNNVNRTNTVNIHDTTEPINRYKNTFTRKPGAAQLENIVEDSESYLSSSQQQSSNFNVSTSVKESSRMYQQLFTDLNLEETHKGRKNSNVHKRTPNAKNASNTSMNVDCSPIGSTNFSKALDEQTNDYVTIDGKTNVYKTNINEHSLRNHLPGTDYYHNHRNKEYARGGNIRQIKDVGNSVILSGGDLKILERPPPTPEPSIHVEMQEYTSDDESDKLKHTSKIGWTFYNNVLGQVNEILQNSGVITDEDLNHVQTARNVEQENDKETRTALNTVKAATLEQLRRLGISLTENNEHRESNGNNKTLDFDSSFYPRLDHQTNMTHGTSAVNETNTSMHMKALALKYLSDDQLADIAWHKQESSSLKHLMLSNMQGTNMSLATMRYLERYQLLPGKNNVQVENIDQTCDKVSPKYDFKPTTANNNPALRRFPFIQTSGTTCPSRILDLSALKKQPKLL